MRRLLPFLLAGAGCLSHPSFTGGSGSGDAGTDAHGDGAADAPAGSATCTSGDDDPLRYSYVTAATALAWDDARDACIRIGMDLAVMDEPVELGRVDPDLCPAWIGQRTDSSTSPWMGVDGCEVASPASGSGACTFASGPNAVAASACDTSANIATALCETPHADPSCARDPSTATYTVSAQALTYADAVAFCATQQAHLVVLDSAVELAAVAQLVPGTAGSAFWFGEQWTGSAWQSETGCPGEFSWADLGAGAQALGKTPSCASAVLQPPPADPDGSAAQVLAGEEVSACDAVKLALCER